MTEYIYNLYLIKQSSERPTLRKLAVEGAKLYSAEYGVFRAQDALSLLRADPARWGFEVDFRGGFARLGNQMFYFDPKTDDITVEAELCSLSVVDPEFVTPGRIIQP